MRRNALDLLRCLLILFRFFLSLFQSLKSWSSTISTEKEELDEKHKNITDDNAMLLAKVQELQNSIPELEVDLKYSYFVFFTK